MVSPNESIAPSEENNSNDERNEEEISEEEINEGEISTPVLTESISVNNFSQGKKKKRDFINRKNFELTFKKITVEENDQFSKGKTCTICFEEFFEGINYCNTPCNHIFHYECLFIWIVTNKRKKCPNDNFRFKVE